MLALDLPATDHRIVIGKDRHYLIGKGSSAASTLTNSGNRLA
jgi:hypothetical protein